MSNYTKSPWSINNWPQNGTNIAVGAVGTPLVAKVQLRDVSVNEQKANAKLIAAAPELLEALQNVLRWMPVYPKEADAIVGGRASYEKAIADAVAALDKALGACKCNFKQKTAGDGCATCNPQRAADYATDKANETEDGPKAAAFDWLMDKIQEAYDLGGWLEVGDMIVTAHSIWGQRDECCVKAEIQWKDRRDEPLDLLSAIEQAKKTEDES